MKSVLFSCVLVVLLRLSLQYEPWQHRVRRQSNDTQTTCPGVQESAKAKGIVSVSELSKDILPKLISAVQNTSNAYRNLKQLPIPQDLSSFDDANSFIAQFQQSFAGTRNQKSDYSCLLRETILRIKLNNYQVKDAPIDTGMGTVMACFGNRWSVCGKLFDAYTSINQGKYNGTLKDVVRTALADDISCLDTDVTADITDAIINKSFDNKDVLQIIQTLDELRILFPLSVTREESSIISGMKLAFQAARKATRPNA